MLSPGPADVQVAPPLGAQAQGSYELKAKRFSSDPCARAWPIWCLGLALLLALTNTRALAKPLELRQAQARVTVQGLTTQETVQLPYSWDSSHAGMQGLATFELEFSLPPVAATPYGLYTARVGSAYEIWLNGTLLQRNGDMQRYNSDDYAKAPRYVQISPVLLQSRNRIRVQVRADRLRNAGLAPLAIGPDEEVYALYTKDFNANHMAPLIVVIFGLQVMMGALALWATQVGTSSTVQAVREPLYLYAGLAEMWGVLSISDLLIETPPLPWPLWQTVLKSAAIGWEFCLILFCVEVAAWGDQASVKWLRLWMVYLVCICAACIVVADDAIPILNYTYFLAELAFMVFASLFIWKAAQGGTLIHKAVAMAIFLYFVMDLHRTYSRYSSVILGLTLGVVVLLRFRDVSVQMRELVFTLELRVAQKEREIERSYRHAEELVRSYERTAERASILRDMHDGVGSHISMAIHQLQDGSASTSDVLQTLHESLDQLRLTIDGINLPPGDISVLLANLRYRLEPRIKSSDIELQWDVQPMEPLSRLDEKAMRHLQYLVFEALSNVLQHAHATLLRIELHRAPDGAAVLRVIDNGRGFTVARVSERGLRSMRDRATAMGARLTVSSAPGNTRVEVAID
jgi:signal transduction histidine kinase